MLPNPTKRREILTQEEARLFETEFDEEEYDELRSEFVDIPPGPSGVPMAGDTIILLVEAGVAEWKTPGTSLEVPLTVVEEGINYGKVTKGASGWFPGIKGMAMNITKRALQAFDIEDKVVIRKDGKVYINPLGFAGAQARATFVRELSNQGNLITGLESTRFYPKDSKTTEPEDLGIGGEPPEIPF